MEKNRKNYKAVLVVMVFVMVCSFLLLPGNEVKVFAAEADSFDVLAEQAVVNSYQRYKTGIAVDDVYGNFGAIDGYVLSIVGIELEHWQNGDTNFKEELLALIKAIPTKENGDSPSSAKQVASGYLLANEWRETETADQLLTILKERQKNSLDGSFDQNVFSDLPAFAALGRARVLTGFDVDAAINFILNKQDEETKAWPTGEYQDFQTTAQAIRTLTYFKPFVENNEDKADELAAMQEAIDQGLAWLKERQLPDGSCQDSSGFDDPLIDTVEVLLTLKTVGIEVTDPDWISSEGKSIVDYLRENALNEDGTFGTFRNPSDNTWALDAFICLGACVSQDTALMIEIEPKEVELAVEEEEALTATAFLVNGDTVDVTTTAEWTVSDSEKVIMNLADEKMVIRRISAGDFELEAIYQTVNCKQVIKTRSSSGGGGSNHSVNEIRVSISVTGENRERLYSGKVTLNKKKATIFDALVATGLRYQGDSNFISAIEGQKNRGLNGWMVKVNDELITAAIDSYTLGKGDIVEWFYSNDSGNSVENIGGSNKGDKQVAASPKLEEIKLDPETYLLLFKKAEQYHNDFQTTVMQFMNDAITYLQWLATCF